jgi:hypothetical protein
MGCLRPYEPINQLKPVGENLWIADGAEVRMRYAGRRFPFTTRMTIVRLPDGKLWVHSPIEPAPSLCRAVDDLGAVAFLISPNRLQTTWLSAWQHRWPEAVTAGVAAERAWDGTRLDAPIDLSAAVAFPWSDVIAQVFVPGAVFSETVFFHLISRTLIVTDLIENFELERVECLWLRLLLRLTGPLHPHGTAPPDMRFSFRRHKAELRAAVAQMRAWAPERIILAHGKWYCVNGEAEVERAFQWIY